MIGALLTLPRCSLDPQAFLRRFPDAILFADHFHIDRAELAQAFISLPQVVSVSALQPAKQFFIRTIQRYVGRPGCNPLAGKPTFVLCKLFESRKRGRVFGKLCQHDHVAIASLQVVPDRAVYGVTAAFLDNEVEPRCM